MFFNKNDDGKLYSLFYDWIKLAKRKIKCLLVVDGTGKKRYYENNVRR